MEAAKTAGVVAVRAACIVTEAVRATLALADRATKEDRSPVTVADFAAQAILIKLLTDEFPNIPVVAEETAEDLRPDSARVMRERVGSHVRACPGLENASEADILELIDAGSASPPGPSADSTSLRYFWCIDPIDGTKGFLRNDQYAVCVGLVQVGTDGWGTAVVGVLGCPRLQSVCAEASGILFHAALGHGAVSESLKPGGSPQVLRVCSPDLPREDVRCVESVEPGHTDQEANAALYAAIGITSSPVRVDSQCKYAIIARGDAALYLRMGVGDRKPNSWDHAAGAVIVAEAGGCCTDRMGMALDFGAGRRLIRNACSLITSNGGGLHGAVVASCAAAPLPLPLSESDGGDKSVEQAAVHVGGMLQGGLLLARVAGEADVQGAAALLCLCDLEFAFPGHDRCWTDRLASAAAGVRSYLPPSEVSADRSIAHTHGPETAEQRERSSFWVLRLAVGPDAGAIVGTVAVHPGKGGDDQSGGPNDPSVAVLARVGLSPALRGRRLGQRLYDAAEEFCVRDGTYTRMWLETSRRQKAARNLYLRNGFTVEQEVDNAWEDSLMSKHLTVHQSSAGL